MTCTLLSFYSNNGISYTLTQWNFPMQNIASLLYFPKFVLLTLPLSAIPRTSADDFSNDTSTKLLFSWWLQLKLSASEGYEFIIIVIVLCFTIRNELIYRTGTYTFELLNYCI